MKQPQQQKRRWWDFGLFRAEPLIEATLTTEVPINVAIEKLRGFVNDQDARIISIRDNRVELEISSDTVGQNRRRVDRPAPYRIELEFSEERLERTNSFGLASGTYAHTVAVVSIRPKKRRNRRRDEQLDRAKLILQRLKAYLMARDADVEAEVPEPVAAH